MADADHRAELLELLCADGIFWSTPEHPIASRDGQSAAWMLDTLRLSLTTRGAELAGRCLLDKLAAFRGRQLATFGITAIPLLQSCIALSGGRYRGIIVRKEPKGYGAQKQIEGPLDTREPVVVIDDSISSGGSLLQCVELLEKAGLHVEGAVVLARFGWGRGFARMIDRGLRMESVYDVHTDLVPRVDPERPRPHWNPSLVVPDFTWAKAASEASHPATYAREVIVHQLRGEPIPRPPARFDREYDAAGGTWVSVRPKTNVYARHARDGLWNFPGEPQRSLGEDIARAAVRTAHPISDPGVLASSAVAVTFFGALEPCSVGQLDNDRYGIVVRSRERVECLGGALPRMPGMTREWQQFEHARKNNAKMYGFEPFQLWRHTVDKAIEPGEPWQPTGVPLEAATTWQHDPTRAGRVAQRAFDLARAKVTSEPPRSEPLPDDLIGPCESLYVTVYAGGAVVGCMGAKPTKLDDSLRDIAEAALADPRFAKGVGELAVTVSFLDHAEPRGVQTPDEIAIRYRHGEQALVVFQGQRIGLLLPFVVFHHSLTPQQYVAEVIDKAGITRPPYNWACFDVHTWLADGHGATRVVFGMPPATPPATIEQAVETLMPKYVGYLLRHHRSDGLRDGLYRPMADRVLGELELPRQVHGAWTLARAARRLSGERLAAVAREAVGAVMSRCTTLVETALLELAERELGAEPDRARIARLWQAIDVHGRITEPREPPTGTPDEIERELRRRDLEHDYVPAQVLLALASDPASCDRAALDRAFAACRDRFEIKRGWGQVAWLPQAIAAWWPTTREHAQLAFDVIDWALEYQQEKSGGFINGEQADSPGFSTGVYLEGLAAALRLAHAVGDAERVGRYRSAARAALRFLDGITYQERDRPLLPNPERAYGGVRLSRTAGDVRIDFVQHALCALLLLDELPHMQ